MNKRKLMNLFTLVYYKLEEFKNVNERALYVPLNIADVNRTLEKFAFESKSRRGSRGSYSFLSTKLAKIWQINFNNHFYNCGKFC